MKVQVPSDISIPSFRPMKRIHYNIVASADFLEEVANSILNAFDVKGTVAIHRERGGFQILVELKGRAQGI